MISEEKQKQIHEFLKEISREKDITIIHAVESGSRAWGFPSTDSDYDIRVIYHHSKDWYLSAFQKKDVIEGIFVDDLDVSGWDIGKCLRLMYKGNAALIEWLHSPVVYQSDEPKLELLRRLSVQTFNPKLVFYHYISLAKKKLLDDKNEYNPKGFLYALRALLCAKWVAEKLSVPPVAFSNLCDEYLQENTLSEQVSQLIKDKENIKESDTYRVAAELYCYAKKEYQQLSLVDVLARREMDMDVYDTVFKSILNS